MTPRRTLTVPAHCPAGHELTPRTTHVRLGGTVAPTGWECLRCLKRACYRAHWGDVEIPPEYLDETEFSRQQTGGKFHRRGVAWPHERGSWWSRVTFTSGWQFTDPDPTPELRARREEQQRIEAERVEQAHRAQIARELDEIELRDARVRAAQRRRDAEASTAAIRAAMSAARGGVVCA